MFPRLSLSHIESSSVAYVIYTLRFNHVSVISRFQVLQLQLHCWFSLCFMLVTCNVHNYLGLLYEVVLVLVYFLLSIICSTLVAR